MSGSNGLPEITLDELERLIRILGMLGSGFDGEILAAGKLAQKWVAEHDTDWRTLLSPPADASPVTGVTAAPDEDAMAKAYEADRVQAYANGYQAGLRAMAALVKAQASYQGAQNAAWTGLGGGLGGAPAPGAAQAGVGQGPQPQGPVRPPGGAPGGASPVGPRTWVPGSWQWVCQELLDRDTGGVPGVFRGAREIQFVTDVLARGFASLTAAQDKWLRDIAQRNGLSW